MWDRPAVGACRPLGLGCSICCARPRDSDAHLSPRAKMSSTVFFTIMAEKFILFSSESENEGRSGARTFEVPAVSITAPAPVGENIAPQTGVANLRQNPLRGAMPSGMRHRPSVAEKCDTLASRVVAARLGYMWRKSKQVERAACDRASCRYGHCAAVQGRAVGDWTCTDEVGGPGRTVWSRPACSTSPCSSSWRR